MSTVADKIMTTKTTATNSHQYLDVETAHADRILSLKMQIAEGTLPIISDDQAIRKEATKRLAKKLAEFEYEVIRALSRD